MTHNGYYTPNKFLTQSLRSAALVACAFFSAFSWGQLNLPDTTNSDSRWGETLFTDNKTLKPVEFLPVEQAYQLSVKKADEQNITIHWRIEPNYYLYQHQTKAFSSNDLSQALPIALPAGIKKYDEVFEQELEVYYNELSFNIPITEIDETIQLHSQGCADAGLCYPPQTHYINITPDDLYISSSLPNAEPATNQATSYTSSSTWLASLFAALLGGIILNLMPCVFPVLSLKALSLMQSHQASHQQHLHGWSYTLGCALTFSVVALIMFGLRQSGQMIGWGFQLQSSLMVAALCYLFFIMGLLLLSNVNIIKASLSGAGEQLTHKQGYSGSFFTGALASVVASPCTAPFMGAALGFAITQPLFVGISIFTALGFGMALPFLLLSYYPNLGRWLPKPGNWMNTLRQFLAFPLFFTAIWLMWVLSHQSGSNAVLLVISGMTLIAMSLWLWTLQPCNKTKRGIAILIFISSLCLLFWVTSTPPTANKALDNDWQPFTQSRLTQLRSNGAPVFVNLTADWCITCLANEKVALDTQQSINAFRQAGIVKLKGDWTNYNPEITQLLNDFGRNGVPLYLFYPSGPNPNPIILPQLLTEKSLLKALNLQINET